MEKNKQELIIDADDAVLGRLASFSAKKALQGNKVLIINCKNAVITGNKKPIKEDYLQKRRRHGSSQKGPIFPKSPAKIIKRTIRGMLPKQGRGREALKNVICFNEIPEKYEKAKTIKAGKEKTSKYVKLEKISKLLGK